MRQLLILGLLLFLPVHSFADDLKENIECKKFYALKLQDDKYVRFKPKQIIDYPNEPTLETVWSIDCKNNKVFFTGGIFEREYVLEKRIYHKLNNIYVIDIVGEEEGELYKYTLNIEYIDNDKAYISAYYDKSIFTISPDKYKLIVK